MRLFDESIRILADLENLFLFAASNLLMATAASLPPVDLEALPKYSRQQLEQYLTDLVSAFQDQDKKIQKLRQMISRLNRWQFGSKAERIDEGQMLLEFLKLIEESPPPKRQPPAEPRKKSRRNGRRAIPKDLPRIPIVHDLPEDQKPCPKCGAMRECFAQDSHEVLDYEPASLHVVDHIEKKYICRPCDGQIATAEVPEGVIQGGLPGEGLLSAIANDKFGNHMPLYRQEGMLQLHGLRIPRSTLCDWMGAVADTGEPIVVEMAADIKQSKMIHSDDTPVRVLAPGAKKCHRSYMWGYLGDENHPLIVYEYTRTHAGEHPKNWLGEWEGYFQVDALKAYDQLFKSGKIIEVGCWAHARRYFFEAKESDGPRALMAMAFIKRLYQVERAAKELSNKQRRKMRMEHAVPILDEMKIWLDEEAVKVLPKSAIGQAISYAQNNWKALTRYTKKGYLDIDNNPAERALRGICIGKKNWMFLGSDEGGRRAAIITSLIESCKRVNVNPFYYLRDILKRVRTTPVSQIEELFPCNWVAPEGTPGNGRLRPEDSS